MQRAERAQRGGTAPSRRREGARPESERDVDTFGANFFARIGNGPYDFPPGTYRVDVWWAGGPAAPGGAIGAGFVLKLYQ